MRENIKKIFSFSQNKVNKYLLNRKYIYLIFIFSLIIFGCDSNNVIKSIHRLPTNYDEKKELEKAYNKLVKENKNSNIIRLDSYLSDNKNIAEEAFYVLWNKYPYDKKINFDLYLINPPKYPEFVVAIGVYRLQIINGMEKYPNFDRKNYDYFFEVYKIIINE